MGLFDKFAARKALLKHSKGETEEAYKEYGELFEAGKMVDAKYLLPYSILLMRRGEYEKAREVLKKAEKSPGGINAEQRATLLTNYAVCCWKLGRRDYALELMEEVHRKNPNGNSYGTLGYLLVENGDFDRALAFTKQALEYDDEDPIALDNMAQTYYWLGGEEGKKEAIKWFKKAINFKPEAIDTNYFLAKYDIEAGDYSAAREKLEICKKGRVSPLNYATRERVDELLASIPE